MFHVLIVHNCQKFFGFALPSVQLSNVQRSSKTDSADLY